jgi:hypothetical protein
MVSFTQIGNLGRLGNQMFQMASTIGIGTKLGYQFRFPSESFNGNADASPDSYEGCKLMDCFEIGEDLLLPLDEIRRNVSYLYRESDFTYNQQTGSLPDGCDLYGYFQTEKYFSHCRDLILNQFKFRDQYSDKASSYVENIRESKNGANVISLHVRRGDYVHYPQHHPTCGTEYYDKAVSEIKSHIDSPIFLVFSDDKEWCKTVFFGDEYIISELDNSYEEMCAMTLCDSHIIANSSFSWWGAWLNMKENKKVISPSNWFGPSIGKDTSDIHGKDWTVI